jgi:predicted nucleic acid-binding Zn ribbon protein
VEIVMKKTRKGRRHCPICDNELDEDEDICSVCGSYFEETVCDAEENLEG